ncbi:MAG: 50S ribosomal protein L13 [Chlamydiia bacterium]|nr:50S ribosomal protein L13 [Chlamydiia bacterium]
MQFKQQKTFMLKQEQVERRWFCIDATGKTLGRLASEIARILRGKHRADYTPHIDSGDGVIVINAEKVAVTGNKEAGKIYRRYTGHMSGMREMTFREAIDRKPCLPIEHAVKGMVPRTRQGRQQMKRLRIYPGANHDMEAQQPTPVDL